MNERLHYIKNKCMFQCTDDMMAVQTTTSTKDEVISSSIKLCIFDFGEWYGFHDEK